MKPIFAIIVTFRRLEHFKKTADSLLATLPRGSRLVIVDNASPEEEVHTHVRHLVDTHPPGSPVTVQALMLDKNVGWGAAMNEGLGTHNWQTFEYVLESNNDVDYEPNWAERAQKLMTQWKLIGILGLWAHPYHGVRGTLLDGTMIKDDMPATAWFFRSKDLAEFLPFPEHGACKTRGGNGEDVAFRDRVQNKFQRWICAPKTDLAHHMDGYDIPDLGKPNEAYL